MPRKMLVTVEIPDTLTGFQAKGLLVTPEHQGGIVGLDETLPAAMTTPREIAQAFGQLVSQGMVEVPVTAEDGSKTWQPLTKLEVRLKAPAPAAPLIEKPRLEIVR